MRFCAKKFISAIVLAAFCVAEHNLAYAQGRLSPQDFNKMYYLAMQGKIGILREAINRGLNIDAVNPHGDTGLCIAIKRKNYVAYNSFRMSGANPRHACTYRIYKEYKEFLASSEAAQADKIVGNKESLYYDGWDIDWKPWLIGTAIVGGGVWALTHKSGGGHSSVAASGGGSGGSSQEEQFEALGYGLAGYVTKYTQKITVGKVRNTSTIDASNSDAENVVNNIKFLPNMLSNASYLKVYGKVMEGASYENAQGGVMNLGDAAIALSAHGKNAKLTNSGSINVDAGNGSIGLVASNGAKAYNSTEDIGVSPNNSSDGSINIIFKGGKEGNAAIGMYADTHSSITNYGKILGVASQAEVSADEKIDTSKFVDDEEADTTIIAANSGTILGMSLFDYYTGTDVSQDTVSATNYGNIKLQAGHNNASDVSISLIGMGSYLDDRFLNGTSNPSFAEQMLLQNNGIIDLAYQKTYNLASDALKLGDGGLIGMRADASTEATNHGTINIDMSATTIESGSDVAAGMLSVHGAGLVNGTTGAVYEGTTDDDGKITYNDTADVTGGTIRMVNEATSGGVFYGMLAAKGSGTQTNIYKWQAPSMKNYGLIDMQVSNSFAMASFAGGEIINDGVINLGQENGQSYYKGNRGLYASGSVSLSNEGTIYISNKATNSKAFAGNYSTAINYNDIFYKVGNSALFSLPGGRVSDIGHNLKATIGASVITSSTVSGSGNITKQYVDNEEAATLVIGEIRTNGIDYGGTFGTAGIQVSKQGSADNKGTIELVSFDEDISQYNTGMWLDDTTTAEAYTDNLGTIAVYAANSIGMRNDTQGGASATNYNKINILGDWDYGMSVSEVGGNIFNGRYREEDREDAVINVLGHGAIGMYVKNGNAYNYGTINLRNHHTTAFQLDGAAAFLSNVGDINFLDGLKDIVWYWTTNDASILFSTSGEEIESVLVPDTVDGFILGKATTDRSGGFAYLSKTSAITVQGEEAHLFVAEGEGSIVSNRGLVKVNNGATAIKVSEGATGYHEGKNAKMTIKDADSIGMSATDRGSRVESTVSSQINVEAGIGLYAENIARAVNGGDISVTGGIGMYVTDGNNTVYTTGQNDGSISVVGKGVIGAKVVNLARFTNTGNISASFIPDESEDSGESGSSVMDINQYAIGVYSNSEVTVSGKGSISAGDNAIGVYGGDVIINGSQAGISASGENSYGTFGADVTNSIGTISASGGAVGVSGHLENHGTVEVRNGAIGVSGTAENYSEINVHDEGSIGVKGRLENNGTVNVYGGYGLVGSGVNSGTISNKGGDAAINVTGTFNNSGTINGNGIGVRVDGGSFTNISKISMTSGTGIYVDNHGNAQNAGTIEIGSGAGMYIKSGSGTNDGTINIGSGNGMYITNGASGYNNGTINLAGSGYGAWINEGGTFTNSGVINYDSELGGACTTKGKDGKCVDAKEEREKNKNNSGGASSTSVVSPLYFASNALFINNGAVNMNEASLDFSDGNYVLGAGGQYQAASFSGEILASQDIVKDGFEDIYTTENAFSGENKGLTATSESYLFEAEVEDNGDTSDIKLTRKNFNDLVEEQDLADFFETNYQLQHNEKMYQSIKSASTQAELDAAVESESGKKFYANLPRENMAVLRGIQHGEQQRILEDGLNGASVGVNYFRTGKDGNGGLSDYADDVYSATLSYGAKMGHGWSMGGALTAAYADSEYDDINSKRENAIIMAFMPILYQNNRLKYLAMPAVGVGYGEYERHATSGNYKADTFDLYYGLYNHAEYSIDMKVAELVTEAELNLQGISSDTAKEKGGLNLKSNDSLSLEAGVGIKLRKRIKLAKQRELMLALGTKYYHEMLDPYKSLTIGMTGSPVNYRLKGYDEDKNRLRTAAEAMYKDGNFALSAEIAHNAEKEESVEGGLGVRYNF